MLPSWPNAVISLYTRETRCWLSGVLARKLLKSYGGCCFLVLPECADLVRKATCFLSTGPIIIHDICDKRVWCHFLYFLEPYFTDNLDYTTSCIYTALTLKSRLKKSNEMQQYADIFLLLNVSTCFGRPSYPSSGVHKTVVAASGTDHTIWRASFLKRDQIRTGLVTFEEACSADSMICTRGCNYSFMYSWWLARWTPETYRVI